MQNRRNLARAHPFMACPAVLVRTGPSAELIAAIVAMKRRNPRFGHMRIAQQISHAFGLDLDKDVVHRVLARHYRPVGPDSDGPSWLTFIAQSKDSLWRVGLFRCLIGTIRREFLDRTFFWNSLDLERKLQEFRDYYDGSRVHRSLDGTTPAEMAGKSRQAGAALDSFGWQEHCRGLFLTPIAA